MLSAVSTAVEILMLHNSIALRERGLMLLLLLLRMTGLLEATMAPDHDYTNDDDVTFIKMMVRVLMLVTAMVIIVVVGMMQKKITEGAK